MMINFINQFLKNLDYKYINFIKKAKSLFNEAFLIFYMYRILKANLPYIFYKFIKKIEMYIYNNICIPIYNKYIKINYTIFNYPKHYNNFRFIEYIKKTIKNDYNDIFDYYLNIFNIFKWKHNIVMLLLLVWFYSILLISNNLIYFIVIKFLFYTLKYIFKYLFIFIDYFFYTYLNFSRIPKFFFGLPYLLLVKNLYKLYYILFYILPLLVFVGYWWTLYYQLKDILIKKVNRFLDIIEWFIFSISKSYLFVLIKKLWYHINYYITEEDKFKDLINEKKFYFKNYYRTYILYYLNLYINFKFIHYIKYFYNNFANKKDFGKRIRELYIYIKYIYPYICFIYKILFMNINYNIKILFIKFQYNFKKSIIIFNNKSLVLYWNYSIIYNWKNIILKKKMNIIICMIYLYNIVLLTLLYIYIYF